MIELVKQNKAVSIEAPTASKAYVEAQVARLEEVDKQQREYIDNNFANALVAHKVGKLATISDLSPIPHNISVSTTKGTKVTCFGKNLLNNNVLSANSWQSFSGGLNNFIYKLDLIDGVTYTFSFGSHAFPSYFYFTSCDKGAEYTNENRKVDKYMTMKEEPIRATTHTFTKAANKDYYLLLSASNGYEINLDMKLSYFDYMQIEVGTTATQYEPYKEVATLSNGETIAAYYPIMNFKVDLAGASVDVKYNRDINKAFAELHSALISLGANV